MATSHTFPPKPSPLLTLICLGIVKRSRPQWTAVSLSSAARESGVSAQRLSRLTSRAIERFEAVIAFVSRRGRPPSASQRDAAATDNAITEALLGVATTCLSHVPLRGATMRALIVGAYLKLRAEQPKLTQKRFCAALSVPERTLRQWLSRAPASTAPADAVLETKAPQPPTKRAPRRPRFGFDVTVADTQLAADTTDLEAFGVPLKLVAAQDVGGRDHDLLDAVIVDDSESAEHVVAVIEQAIGDKTGQQVITDQGTPYLAHKTREALDALDADHAVQKEADPLGKATIERAFGTVKAIAQPLLSLSSAVAERIPALRRADLARAVTTLLLIALLRAYQAGARAARRADAARAGLDAQTLARAAEDSRQRARAEHRSARQLLGRIHFAYQLQGCEQRFIRTFRTFPLSVLQRAETAFAAHAHRGDIEHRSAYFAAIVHRIHRDHRADLARRERNQRELDRARADTLRHHKQLAAHRQDPAGHLAASLDLLAYQLDDKRCALRFSAAGLGRAWLRAAIDRLAQLHGDTATRDIAAGLFNDFVNRRHDLGDDAIDAIGAVARQLLDARAQPSSTQHCAASFTSAILNRAGPNTRSGPSPPLRI